VSEADAQRVTLVGRVSFSRTFLWLVFQDDHTTIISNLCGSRNQFDRTVSMSQRAHVGSLELIIQKVACWDYWSRGSRGEELCGLGFFRSLIVVVSGLFVNTVLEEKFSFW
jgi:hypothetical protein